MSVALDWEAISDTLPIEHGPRSKDVVLTIDGSDDLVWDSSHDFDLSMDDPVSADSAICDMGAGSDRDAVDDPDVSGDTVQLVRFIDGETPTAEPISMSRYYAQACVLNVNADLPEVYVNANSPDAVDDDGEELPTMKNSSWCSFVSSCTIL